MSTLPLAVQSPPALHTVEVMFAAVPMRHGLGMPAKVAVGPKSSVTGFAESVPKVKVDQSSEAVPEMASVPSASVVAAARFCERAILVQW